MIDDNDGGSKDSDTSCSREQVQTLSMVNNTEARISSENLNNLNKRIMSVALKGSDINSRKRQ